ncbi:MAG: UDP-N-acetylmuramoyl-L-alanine--D-glutamate ligase [Chromatiales bacterium]|nr:UDP-N-acetylmuramoyl-L-alanine--D-glutamate ligase [Chromatiales bacterium]
MAQASTRSLVLGMGETGAALARWLARQGRSGRFADSRVTPPGLQAIRAALPDALLEPGALPSRLPADTSDVLVSPGVPLGLPLIAEARARGIPVRSDIDVFAAEATAPVLGVTGSNGKSTVTALAGVLLETAGVRVATGGNLGTPATDLLAPGVEAFVLELSSFQLERSGPLPLAGAALLNLTPDHLDQHEDLTAYAAAKSRIYMAARVAVINRDQPALWRNLPGSMPRVGFGLGSPGADDFGLRAGRDGPALAHGERLLLPVSELNLAGRHNVSNALASLALVSTLGVDPASCIEGLRNFRGLPHRMQLVSRALGARWVDDSKATNVGAAVTAIDSTPGSLVLIAGGDAKNQDFAALAIALRGRDCTALLLGRDRERLADALRPACPVELVDDLAVAVSRAAQLARPGLTVLLAPACSSLDMFSGYTERGEVFRRAVQALVTEDAG